MGAGPSVPEGFNNERAIETETVDLSAKELSDVPELPPEVCTACKKLRLARNGLTSVPSQATTADVFPNLAELDVNRNLIVELPSFAEPIRGQLVFLGADGNALVGLEPAFAAGAVFASLTKLNVSRNGLVSLPSTLAASLPALIELNIGNNALTAVEDTDEAWGFPALVALYAFANDLESIPNALIAARDSLTFVDVSVNRRLDGIDVLHEMPALRDVLLQSTAVARLDDRLFTNFDGPRRYVDARHTRVGDFPGPVRPAALPPMPEPDLDTDGLEVGEHGTLGEAATGGGDDGGGKNLEVRLSLPDEILADFLWLGAFDAATNQAALEARGITHVLVAGDNLPMPFVSSAASGFAVKYLQLPLLDAADFDILSHLERAVAFIDDASGLEGGRVLVHCHRGVSRSGTIVIAYLMSRFRLRRETAMAYARACRPKVGPNGGFWKQLGRWEARLRGEESSSGTESS